MIFLFLYAVPYWGSLYFNMTRRPQKSYSALSFRPLLGFFIFQYIVKFYHKIIERRFPSPIGVLYISIIKVTKYEVTYFEFPSPIGVLYISIITDIPVSLLDSVSVPYWGSLYFNRYGLLLTLTLNSCFRPLLGFFIFQCRTDKRNVTTETSFRPLLGFFIFQFGTPTDKEIEKQLFPSPTGVLYISIGKSS